MQKTPDSYTGMTDVKPPILESPLQTRRIAWRRRYAAPAILDIEHKEKIASAFVGAIFFVMKNLPATLLE
jgi:hypothetical protein